MFVLKSNITFLDVIHTVLHKNLSLQSLQKDVVLKEQDVKIAKSSYFPKLSVSATGAYVDPDSAENSFGQQAEFSTAGNVTFNQVVFSYPAIANIHIQRNLQQAQKENFSSEQLNAVFEASQAYFNALIGKSNAQIRLRNLTLTKKNLQIAEQSFDAGHTGKSDLLRFQSQMAQDTQAIVETVNQLEQNFISLNQLLNNPDGMEIDIEDVELNDDLFRDYNYDAFAEVLDNPELRKPLIEFLIQEGKANAPELKALAYHVQATERSIRLYGLARFLPSFSLQAQYNRTFNRLGAGSSAPVGVTLLDP